MESWWVWCGSVVRGADKRFHMFASRWPRTLPFMLGYTLRSEVVHAVADHAVGPYHFVDIALPARGPEHWDGRMTHNPTIHKWRGKYYMYYIGSSYSEPSPADDAKLDTQQDRNLSQRSWEAIRIGVGVADSLDGPWVRFDRPILDVRPDKWDHRLVTNPAPCIRDDGTTLMLYRSPGPNHALLGAAIADSPVGPFRRLSDSPVFEHQGDERKFVEDPYIWATPQGYSMIAKDLSGKLTGEVGAGVLAHSANGVDWHVNDSPKAYSRTVTWSDGSVVTLGCFERPQLLMSSGVPTHLFAAAADGPGGFNAASRTWTIAVPLRH